MTLTFAHDPRRVHPPAHRWGLPSIAEEENVRVIPVVAPRADPETPRTLSDYNDNYSMVAVAIGASGEPYRIVFINTIRQYRNQGYARALFTKVLADIDADKRDSTTIIRNIEPDCDPLRLAGFFESFGYAQVPDQEFPTLHRAYSPA